MKIIKLYFKYLYRIIVNNLFFIIYGKIHYKKNYKNNLKINTLKNSLIKKKNKFNYKIFNIENGRVCTDGVEQVAYIANNNIIDEISYTQINGRLVSAKRNFVLEKGTPYLMKKVNGTVLSLAQGASGNNNYFHWMFDILPKIKIAISYYPRNKIDYFYMPKLQDFQKRILKILNINFKVIDSSKFKHLSAKNIIVPEHPWYIKNRVFDEVEKLPKWIIKWLSSSFKTKPWRKKTKVFIDRSESVNKHCQLINNQEVIDYLKKKNFKILKIGKYDFLEQIKIFSSAKIIIGPHGAAFTNLVFCKSKTKVIEIKPADRPNNYRTISKFMNLNYKQIKTKPTNNLKNTNGDIFLNIKYLKNII